VQRRRCCAKLWQLKVSFSSPFPFRRQAKVIKTRPHDGETREVVSTFLTRARLLSQRAQILTGGEASVSNKSNLRFLVVLLSAALATAALVFADIGVLAQNTNSSTTAEAGAQNANTTTATHRRHRARRRGRGHRRAAAAAAATDAGMAQDANASGNVGGDQTDLSGTYTGNVTMSGGHEMSGPGTLTITGNQFTLESGGMNHSGRIYAVTTRGYTGAAFYFPDLTDPSTKTPVVANARARKSGDRLTLSPVPGASTRLTFGTGGGGGGRRGRGRGGRRSAAAPADMSAPADTSTPADTSMSGTESTGTGTGTSRRGRGRRGRRGGSTMNANAGDANANTGDASMSGGNMNSGGENSNMGTGRGRTRGRRGSRRGRGTMNSNSNTNTGDNSNTTPPM
jgi:hypothetical protein